GRPGAQHPPRPAAGARVHRARTAERRPAAPAPPAGRARAGAPPRPPPARARQRRQERDRCAIRRPELERDTERLGGVSRQADEAVASAESGLEQLRTERDEAAHAAEAATQAVRDLSNAHAALAAVTIPDGVG